VKVYRIGNPEYLSDFSGYGASLMGGRWNPKGVRMLYTAQTSSLAILELLANIKGIQIAYQLLEIEILEGDVMTIEDFGASLHLNWSNDRTGKQLTQKIGNDWIESRASALLKVPSVHNPFEHNYLINPLNQNLKLKESKKSWYLYDYRLVEKPDY
jgi:RES domain-containing protein